jgi:anti-anti-sigma factor
MRIDEEKREGVLVMAPVGRVDSTTSEDLEKWAQVRLEAGETRLVVDLSGVEYISSAGLRVLLLLAKRLKGPAGGLALCGLTPPVRQVLDLAGFLPLFPLHASREEALAGLVAGSGRP